jgi:SUN domain-containing protein 1/2
MEVAALSKMKSHPAPVAPSGGPTRDDLEILRTGLEALERKVAAASDVDALRKELAASDTKDLEAVNKEESRRRKDVEALRMELIALENKSAAATAAATAAAAAAASDVDVMRKESAAQAKSAAAAAKDGKGGKDTYKEVEALRKEVAALAKPKGSPLEDELGTLRKELAALTKAAKSKPAAPAAAAAEVALREEVAALGRAMRAQEAGLQLKMDRWKGRPLVTKGHVVDEVKLQLEVFEADRTGKVDYALFSGGRA